MDQNIRRLLLSLFVPVLLLTACQDMSEQDRNAIELVAWVSYKETEHNEFVKLANQFTANYRQKTGKTVKIIAKQVPFDDLVTNIKMASMSNRTPDIARIDVPKMLELAYHKTLVPLDQLENFGAASIEAKAAQYMQVPFYTNVIEVKNNQGQSQRHLYGLPEQTTCLALFWNRKMFRERAEQLQQAGLDPKRAPRTWDELIRYGRVLTYKRNDDHYYGFAMDNTLWWTMPFFGCYGAQFIRKDENGNKVCILGDTRTTAAFQLKVDLYRRHQVEGGAWKSGAIGPDVGFINEKYAMIFMGPWYVKKFREKGLDFGVALIPSISDAEAKKVGLSAPPVSATNIGGNNMVIFRSCRYPQIAYAFLNFITSCRAQLQWCQQLQQIPVNREAADILLGKKKIAGETIKIDATIQIFMEQIKYAVMPPQVPRYRYIESDAVNPEMELALKGQKSVQQALQDAASKINANVLSLVNE